MDDVEREFTLRGKRHPMKRHDFVDAVRGQSPRPIQAWAVDVAGVLYPSKQVFGAATEAPQFTTHEANAVLQRFGFEPFDINRRPISAGDTAVDMSGKAGDGTERQESDLRITALREAIPFVVTRPGTTAEDVLNVAERFEAWLSR